MTRRRSNGCMSGRSGPPFVLSAYRLREHVDHLLDLSFTAADRTLLVARSAIADLRSATRALYR